MDQIEQSLVEDKRRRIVENVQVELLKRLLPRRSPQMAKKVMQRIQDHHEKMMENHRELLMVMNEKKGQELKNGDVFNKLSEANENRLEAIRESMVIITFYFENKFYVYIIQQISFTKSILS
ncbi:uncharacterized protein [Magallana gigas]|uniref:uncharacterized protein n=1 Tax=Magallana gigas TaxID=29159 RepID=UPI0033415243